ncbi:MAG TPA: DUF3604 domain-containing protein [Terriglobales bacterium]|nr:DUF3604 domain-containing protein [Terriglobales bacterium]
MKSNLKAGLALGTVVMLMILPAFGAPNPDRDAYYGETHVHTSWSLDAWLFGNRITDPGDAYKYFMGETIKHPLGFDIKIDTPIDFAGVTDHSEYVGVIRLANTPGSALSKLPAAQPLIMKGDTPTEMQRIFIYGVTVLMGGPPVKPLMSPEVASTVWKQNVQIADQYYKPGKFTTFASYEWTAMPNNMNLHRNVFFKDTVHIPEMPFTALDSSHPEDLWNWMDAERKKGNELLCISHNANLSDGRMFPIDVDSFGRPIDAAWASSRDRNERLTEIKQIKGQSETHPLLSPNDEFANYEILSWLLGGPEGRIPHVFGSYVRQAYKDGLTMQDTAGYNPYKVGVVGASDSHNTGVPYRQDNFFGGHAAMDGAIKERMSGHLLAGMDARLESPAGLAGVWAEENTRESIFNAMQRKETFAVSGPHIKVRFFGGWQYTPEILTDKDWVKNGYSKGVPMGADLPAATGTPKAPTFIVWGVKDPTSGNLDRIQIVKGWSQSGQSFEKIYDVVWAGDRKPDKWTGKIPPIASTVDIETATYQNTIGAVELKLVWTDPDFDPSLNAFYYARVLEIPTPRWTTIQAKELGIAPPGVVSPTVQERAWTSPIWYTPNDEARKAAKPGVTVAELTKNGAVALDNAQLKDLMVDKTVWIQNTVTGEKFEFVFAASGKQAPAAHTVITGEKIEGVEAPKEPTPIDPGYLTQRFNENQGQFIIYHAGMGKRVPPPSEIGDVAQDGYLGVSMAYYINDGKILTAFAGTPVEVTVYKMGDKLFAARNNEFGYANYEIIKPPAFVMDPANP